MLPVTLTNGIISLLPKGQKSKLYLKNWRPICLLNVGYKLVSGALADRIGKIISKIVHPDQCGFIRTRYIGECIRSTYDILDWARNNNKNGLMFIIDFEKAFDTVSFKCILDVLKFFNFKESIINKVRVLLNNFKGQINHAGNISDIFNINRGARQGDPISSLLFKLVIEILAIKLRNSKLIKGFKTGSIENILSMFADDVSIYLELSETNLRNTVEVLDNFYLFSGLKIQLEKSQCIIFGSPHNIQPLCPDLKLKWCNDFNVLGVNFTATLDNMDSNYSTKIENIEETINNWKYRYLSPYGKNCISKTLLLPKLTHLALSLPCLNNRDMKKLEDIIYRFIWDSKNGKNNDKVARVDAQLPENRGGLNMPDLKSSWEAYKMSWIKRLHVKRDSNWAKILELNCQEILPYADIDFILERAGTEDLNTLIKHIKNPFWKNCLSTIQPIMREILTNSPEEIICSPIWGSRYILRNNQMVKRSMFRSIEQKINYPWELFTEENGKTIFTPTQILKNSLGGEINEEEITQIKYIVKENLQTRNINLEHITLNLPMRPLLIKTLMYNAQGCNYWTKLLKRKLIMKSKIGVREEKWDHRLGNRQGLPLWDKTYMLTKEIDFDNRVKWFQYQLTRGALKTNHIVSKWERDVDELCTFCNREREDNLHLMWNCEITQDFLRNMNDMLETFWPDWVPIHCKKTFIFGNRNKCPSSSGNFITYYIKHFIWLCRCKKNLPTTMGFKNYIRNEIRILLICISNYPKLGFLANFDINNLI